MINPTVSQTKFLKSLSPGQLANLERKAENYVLNIKYPKHGYTSEDIQHYAETQLPKRGNKKIHYAWALLNWSCPKVNSSDSVWEEWEEMVIGWTKG